jgi:hypothetical protein
VNLLDLLAALKSLGVPQRALYREIGPAASALRAMTLLRDPAARIPADLMVNLLAAAERYICREERIAWHRDLVIVLSDIDPGQKVSSIRA